MKILLTEEQLRAGVERMAREIYETYANGQLTIVAVLTGSLVLVADLIRKIDLPTRLGVLQASSYRGATTTRGELTINAEPLLEIANRDVLLVDDIFDTGHTLVNVLAKMHEYSPRSVRTAVLLRKRGRQEVQAEPDFIGFEIPDEFVVGYGLDYEDLYRNLPYLAALDADDLSRHRTLAISEQA